MNSVQPSAPENARSARAELPRQDARPAAAAIGLDGGTRMIRRQLEQRRRACQRLLPEAGLARQFLALQPVALPGREIRVLHGKFRQRRLAAGDQRAIDRGQIAEQHARRPGIGDHVMGEDQQHVILRAERAAGARGAAVPAPDRTGDARVPSPAGAPPASGAPSIAHDFQGHREPRRDHLHGLAVPRSDRASAASRAVRPGHRPRAAAAGYRDGRAAAPAAARCRRHPRPPAARGTTAAAARTKRETPVAAAVDDHARCRIAAPLLAFIVEARRQCRHDDLTEGSHRRALEQQPQRQLHRQRVADPRHQLRGQQRVAAQRKEVIVDPDALAALPSTSANSRHSVSSTALRGAA